MRYARSASRVSAEAARAMSGRGVGAEWIHPSTGEVRRYLDREDMGEIIGLRVSYYKTGRCSGCSYVGPSGGRVQVAHDRGWLDWSKVFVGGDGHVYSGWEPEGDCIAELVATRINEVFGKGIG